MANCNCDEIKKWLDEARSAYHDLATGQAVRVVVDQNGERVEYQPAQRNLLAQYIQQLQDMYDDCMGNSGANGRARGPLRFFN